MCRVFFGHADPDPRIVGIGRRVFELTEFLHDMLGVTDTGRHVPAQSDDAHRLPRPARVGRGRAADDSC